MNGAERLNSKTTRRILTEPKAENLKEVAARRGFEPRLKEPETFVLPLDERAIRFTRIPFPREPRTQHEL